MHRVDFLPCFPIETSSGVDGNQTTFADAINNIETKVALLRYCYDKDSQASSSIDAGYKSNPTCIIAGDISTSTDNALSCATFDVPGS